MGQLPSPCHAAGQGPPVNRHEPEVPCGLESLNWQLLPACRDARQCAAEAEVMRVVHARTQKVTVPELEEKLLAAGGPQTQATRPSYVKFHDNKARPAPALQLVTNKHLCMSKQVACYSMQTSDRIAR